jgi:hypothetical protein
MYENQKSPGAHPGHLARKSISKDKVPNEKAFAFMDPSRPGSAFPEITGLVLARPKVPPLSCVKSVLPSSFGCPSAAQARFSHTYPTLCTMYVRTTTTILSLHFIVTVPSWNYIMGP